MKTKIVALYCRVSTEMQRDKGESIEHQKARLKEFAVGEGHDYKFYVDAGFSAKDTNRPAMKILIEDIKQDKVKGVVVLKLDRISRNIKDLINLLELFDEKEVFFKSITQSFDTSTPVGRGMLRIMGEFAQIEREMISDRVAESMVFRAKKGKMNGGVVPFGYMSYSQLYHGFRKAGISEQKARDKALKLTPEDKKMYINPEEAPLVRKIFAQYIEMESLRSVTHWLNSHSYKTRENGNWAATSVRRILSNPTYIGKIWYNKRVSSKTTGKLKARAKEDWIIEPGEHKPIIAEKEFDMVQKILERQSTEPRRKLSEYLLSGLVRCGKCGGSLNGYTQRIVRNNKEVYYSYYKCHHHFSQGKSVCEGLAINRKLLEKLVVEKILSLADSKDFKVNIEKCRVEYNNKTKQTAELKNERIRLEKRNTEIEAKRKNLLDYLLDKTITKEQYIKNTKEFDEEFKQNQDNLDKLEVKISSLTVDTMSFETVYDTVKNFRLNWKYLDFGGQKTLLWTLISKIIVKDKQVSIEVFFLPSMFVNNQSRTDTDSWPPPA